MSKKTDDQKAALEKAGAALEAATAALKSHGVEGSVSAFAATDNGIVAAHAWVLDEQGVMQCTYDRETGAGRLDFNMSISNGPAGLQRTVFFLQAIEDFANREFAMVEGAKRELGRMIEAAEEERPNCPVCRGVVLAQPDTDTPTFWVCTVCLTVLEGDALADNIILDVMDEEAIIGLDTVALSRTVAAARKINADRVVES